MKDESQQQILEERKYATEQLVWAKITGHPWWPAQIIQVPSTQDGKYQVQFFGDYTIAFLTAKKLVDYAQWRDQYSTPKKPLHKNFVKARSEADDIMRHFFQAKRSTSQPSGGSDEHKLKQNQIIIELSSQNNQQDKFLPQTGKKEDYDICVKKQSLDFSQLLFKSESNTNSPKKNKKSSVHGALKKQVELLLEKYNLHRIEEKKPKMWKANSKKKKEESQEYSKQDEEQYDEKQIRQRLNRTIYKVLRKKSVPKQKLKTISISLCEELLKDIEMMTYNLNKLFNWLNHTPIQQISQDYTDWRSK